MDYFNFKKQQAYCEDVSLQDLATRFETPLYVYSRRTILRHVRRLIEVFSDYPTKICYAMKANSNHYILKLLAAEGLGADLVSGGELQRALKAGIDPADMVFSGVGKTKFEIEQALRAGILSFNVESAFELGLIEKAARELNCSANVSLRVNPNIDAATNPKISTGLFTSKFGSSEEDALAMAMEYHKSSHINVMGLSCHIGSQIMDLGPLKEAGERMVSLVKSLKERGCQLKYLNLGGGLGIRYANESPPELDSYAKVLKAAAHKADLALIIEPGRLVMGNAGILLTRVIGVKSTPRKKFVVVDGAMNDLLRPSLYDSYHEILPVVDKNDEEVQCYDIVGPICESGDFFGKERKLPLVKQDDLLWVRGCGAYASSMASNYNSRPRAAEVIVDGNDVTLIRKRERIESIWQDELIG